MTSRVKTPAHQQVKLCPKVVKAETLMSAATAHQAEQVNYILQGPGFESPLPGDEIRKTVLALHQKDLRTRNDLIKSLRSPILLISICLNL